MSVRTIPVAQTIDAFVSMRFVFERRATFIGRAGIGITDGPAFKRHAFLIIRAVVR